MDTHRLASALQPALPDPVALRRFASLRLALPIAGTALALFVGLQAAAPSPEGLFGLAAMCGLGLLVVVVARPFVAIQVLLASSMLLVVFIVVGLRAVNAFDLLLPPILAATYLGPTRRLAVRAEARQRGPGHDAIRQAKTRLVRSAGWFFGAAIASLVVLYTWSGAAHAGDSALLLIRAIEGLVMFPLCLWWLRSERELLQAIRALLIGGLLLAAVNFVAVPFWHVKRAGLTWVLNYATWPITSPNEAGTATLLMCVLALVRQGTRHRIPNFVFIAVSLILLVMSQSRAGLLAWLAFALLMLPRARGRYILAGALTVLALLPLVPEVYWTRMARTLTVERGTFEAYSILVRFYVWDTAWKVLVDHPLMGVGYMGFRFLSDQYNSLRFLMGATENYFLEVAVSMGLLGMVLFYRLIAAIFHLGRVVKRVAPPDTLAGKLARYHAPLMVALLVANLTADNFVGMVGVCQVALWNALLIRAGHQALERVETA